MDPSPPPVDPVDPAPCNCSPTPHGHATDVGPAGAPRVSFRLDYSTWPPLIRTVWPDRPPAQLADPEDPTGPSRAAARAYLRHHGGAGSWASPW